MDISTFNQFIERHLNDDNYKIIESRLIKVEYIPYNCVLPYLSEFTYDFLYSTIPSICYTIIFSYHIIKKTLFNNYESADISIKDDLYFFDKADADLYLKYAKCPSEPLNKYLQDINYIGIPDKLTNINILSFNQIEHNDFIAIKIKNEPTYLFTKIDYIEKYTKSLTILFEQYDIFKDDKKDDKITEKYVDPKIEFIVRDEIERTERYLKTLKQII